MSAPNRRILRALYHKIPQVRRNRNHEKCCDDVRHKEALDAYSNTALPDEGEFFKACFVQELSKNETENPLWILQ
jgi:hypothetical protein